MKLGFVLCLTFVVFFLISLIPSSVCQESETTPIKSQDFYNYWDLRLKKDSLYEWEDTNLTIKRQRENASEYSGFNILVIEDHDFIEYCDVPQNYIKEDNSSYFVLTDYLEEETKCKTKKFDSNDPPKIYFKYIEYSDKEHSKITFETTTTGPLTITNKGPKPITIPLIGDVTTKNIWIWVGSIISGVIIGLVLIFVQIIWKRHDFKKWYNSKEMINERKEEIIETIKDYEKTKKK